ncbi:putative polyphenol oxidase [Klebsormidium nitens]|uniref:Putative polyphenol oxidase n=1 Tax=Klebsormidium nitens TaxID=105231 RepID=A0A1Y1IBB9_KLENI|nr:putative polyphenol oxidase [Klebsormidium nitens]|eukprot:GAQ86709.1 putative polyphenol oxidase [Klebsormidium nitens]
MMAPRVACVALLLASLFLCAPDASRAQIVIRSNRTANASAPAPAISLSSGNATKPGYSGGLLGFQPDGGLYITPDVINQCESLPGTASDGSGNAMLLTASGTVTDEKEKGTDLGNCCPPPYAGAPVAWQPYGPSRPIVVRRSWLDVQNDTVYMEKLARGFKLMRTQGPNSPNSLLRQARVHCHHCTTAKTQGYIHNGWHFLPWHRAEIFYFEQSMQYLLNDPTFAMPYWEWDNPEGVWLINQYRNRTSPLFDQKRTQNDSTSIKMMNRYCSPQEVYKAITAVTDPVLFHGLRDTSVSQFGNQGTLEALHGWPHTAVGAQAELQPGLDTSLFPDTGSCATCRFHDMGSFSTSGWDPAFWSHHFNIDRLWEEWLKQPNANTTSGHNENFADAAWLDSVFTFYRADGVLETITVRDTLNITNMGYAYAPARNIWNTTNAVASGVAAAAAVTTADPPAPVRKLLANVTANLPPVNTVPELLAQYPNFAVNYANLTAVMPEPVKVGRNVSRYRILRTLPDLPGTEELLMFHEISARMDERALIEVWVNKPDVSVGSKLDWHYLGTLTQVPMSPKPSKLPTNSFSAIKNRALQLNPILKNLGLLSATELLITLVPAEYMVDSGNNGFRMAPQYSTVTIAGAEIYRGTLSSYFQR